MFARQRRPPTTSEETSGSENTVGHDNVYTSSDGQNLTELTQT